MSLDDRHASRSSEWVSVHEAAALMGVSPATLRRWSDAGTIVAFTTPGGHRRFSRTAIAGLLPQAAASGSDRQQIDRLREAVWRAVQRAWREVAWARSIGALDEVALAAHGRRIVDGLVVALGQFDDGREPMRAARRSAWTCGATTARHGIGLRPTMEGALRLQASVVREVAATARRLDLDAATTSAWLETTNDAIQTLLGEAMRGHEQTVEALRAAGRRGHVGRPRATVGRPAPASP